MPAPTASVIVPTARGGERLRALLESLAHDAGEGAAVETIVVDNASGDPGMASLSGDFHGVEVLEMAENVGFGRAVNVAARKARGDVLVLVNDDCVCEPGFVRALAERVDPATGLTMVAGILREGRDPALIDSAGIEVDRTLLAFDYLNGEPLALLDRSVADPLGPCGGAAAYERRAFLDSGGFDESLFAFWEDVDLALRLRLSGQRCALAADARAVHEHSGTLGAGSSRKNWLMGFGRTYLLRKYGVIGVRRLPGALLRDAIVCAGQLAFDRNAAGIAGRIAGWRAARRAHSYPRELIESFGPPSAASTLRRRAARRSRLRSSAQTSRARSRPAPGAADERSGSDPRPLRALAVFHVAELSGPALSLEGRLRWLAEDGSLDVIVPGEGPSADLYGPFANVHTLDYEALTLPRGPLAVARTLRRLRRDIRAFRALIREVQPDVAVIATAMLPAAQIAARREGVMVVLEASELLTSGRSAPRRTIGRRIVRAAGRRADAIFACSHSVAAEYEAQGWEATVVYPPIEEHYAGGDGAAFRRRHGIDADAPLVLAAGSITARRGQDTAMEAIAIVRRELPAVLVIAGEPFPRPQDRDFERRLRAAASELGPGAVVLTGFEPRIADAYAAADVVVNPRRDAEAFGRAPCEALLAGTPVVAARTGAVPEVLRDGESALLVPPGDAAAMAEAVLALLRDPDLGRRLVDRGAADVRKRFTASAARARFSAGLAAAMEARRRAPRA